MALARLIRAITMGRAPAINAATAIKPVGPAARLNAPIVQATAAGRILPVAIARSTEHHVSSAPRQMIGSGRSPLLNGNHDARNTKAAVHGTIRLVVAARPRRGSTSWDRISHTRIPQTSAGRRIHGLAVVTCASHPNTW